MSGRAADQALDPTAGLSLSESSLSIDRRMRGWRGPAFAAAVAMAGATPGLLALPPLDRDESRFAQASAQMLESGDFTEVRFQSTPREKKPVGVHWLQATSVTLFSSAEARHIGAYRLPSLLGAMLAAAACAWGAARFWGSARGAAAGALLGASLLLSSEGFIAKTDAPLCGATTLALAALARIYADARTPEAGLAPGRRTRLLLWLGVAAGLLLKGPVTPLVMASTLLSLALADRDARWMRGLGWGWGVAVLLAVCGPWAAAVTVATDGGFWMHAYGQDIGPKIVSAQEGHGAPPGFHALLAPLLFFPGSLLLPAAAVAAWRGRNETGVRFALAWLLPCWLLFEAAPTKLPHYTLPLYGALAWLCAAALGRPAPGRWARATGAVLGLAAGAVIAGSSLIWARRYGGEAAIPPAVTGAAFALIAGGAGAALLWLKRPWAAAAAAGVGGLVAHAVIAGALAPRLDSLWISRRTAELVARAGLDPRNGVTPGPIAVAGYTEPSLIFALGTETELDTPQDAADAVAVGQPALVEAGVEPAFLKALGARGAGAVPAGQVSGFDYSEGRKVRLTLWRPRAAP